MTRQLRIRKLKELVGKTDHITPNEVDNGTVISFRLGWPKNRGRQSAIIDATTGNVLSFNKLEGDDLRTLTTEEVATGSHLTRIDRRIKWIEETVIKSSQKNKIESQ